MYINKIENGFTVTLVGAKYVDRTEYAFPTWAEVLDFIKDKPSEKKSNEYY